MPVARRPVAVLVAVLAVATLGAPAAQARGGRGGGGGDEARVRTSAGCGRAARTRLELRGRDGAIRTDWKLERGRAGERWRIVVVQEARVVWRGTRTISSSGRIEQRLALRDLPGADRVDVRASGPRGTSCAVGATLRG
ncbi:hypothetical protein [Patulibacter sp.]|uniref:hypothetical protein n=1 Tax=Patulibacter sp. TaxID=1912859 RepID=UPI002717A0CF|nr:hypothetical protein [Patulibacter sp.]MDO9408153.1 hypothetical protein [Patulibacter sp.]